MASSLRLETFTEAVPLSVSSLAYTSIPLEEGLVDGVRQLVSHTLLSCVNYARNVYPRRPWTFRDIGTGSMAWTAVPEEPRVEPTQELPFSLQRLNFHYHYSRTAWIHLKSSQQCPPLPSGSSQQPSIPCQIDPTVHGFEEDWTKHAAVMGRISFLYASTERLTPDEMMGTDSDDIPSTILYRVVVEYRSLPPTGNRQAVQAEELSMLSFGGSVDDDVKVGALASLYDESAKYVLEIYSVRGKKYKFDLMDSTLSTGLVPVLSINREGDPYIKCLCATVTDHSPVAINSKDKQILDGANVTGNGTETTEGTLAKGEGRKRFAITRMHLTLGGKPRSKDLRELPSFDFMAKSIMQSYLQLNPQPPAMVIATPSGHGLILDPSLAGCIYVNGRYVTQWGNDPRIGSTGVALFGMDLHSIPFWHGRIIDYEALKQAYATLWTEILVDAHLLEYNIPRRLLYRLMMGYEPVDDGYEDDDGAFDDVDTDMDCLETQILAAPSYDRVGVAAKALGTRFTVEFGRLAFPCLDHEVEWVRSALPGRKPVVVPERLIKLLRRGGHFDVQRTVDELMWFANSRPPKHGEEMEVVLAAVDYLMRAGCDDVTHDMIKFVASPEVNDPVAEKGVCRFSRLKEQFCVQERFMSQRLNELGGFLTVEMNGLQETRAYLLGLYIAMEHPDGNVLARYILKSPGVGR